MEKMQMRQQLLLDHLKPETGRRAAANVVVSLPMVWKSFYDGVWLLETDWLRLRATQSFAVLGLVYVWEFWIGLQLFLRGVIVVVPIAQHAFMQLGRTAYIRGLYVRRERFFLCKSVDFM